MPADWRDHRGTRAVLRDAEYLHLAVATSRGIHVTPTVFSVEAGELWMVVPRRSVKALAVRRHPTVGVLVQGGDRSVVLSGRARSVDPVTGRGLTSPGRILELPVAAAGYLDRNHRHAVGVARGRPVPTLPLSRMAIAVDVRLAALVEDGDLTATWGGWPHRQLLLAGPVPVTAPPDDRDVHPRPGRLLTQDGAAVLGWPSCAGPVALPARWEAANSTAIVAPALMSLAGCWTNGPGCVTLDRIGHGLQDKFGVMVAGGGSARLDGTARAAISPERVIWWAGDHSGTVNRRTA